MTALMVQTLLLMLPAFFLGAAMACGLRKLIQPAEMVPVRVQPTAVEPLPQYAARATPVAVPTAAIVKAPSGGQTATVAAPMAATPVVPARSATEGAAAANRFDETLKARPAAAPSVAAAAPMPVPVAAAVPGPRPAPPPPAAPMPAPAPMSASAPTAVTPRASIAATPAVVPTAEMIAGAAAAMAATTAAVTAQAAAAAAKPAPSPALVTKADTAGVVGKVDVSPSSGVVVPAMRDNVVSMAADDLTRISVIDEPLNAQLSKLGVTRFSQIAGWRKPDVDGISQALGFQGRIEQENWIEQAQILAGGGETFYSARRTKAAQVATPAAPTAVSRPAVAMPTAPVAAPVAVSAPKVEERAAFANKPAPQQVSAAAASGSIPVPLDRIAVPAAAAGVAGTPAMKPAASPAPEAAPTITVTPNGAGPVTAKAADPAAVSPAAPTSRPSMAPTRDVLQRIGSINGEIEKLLGGQGVTRYTQIAGWGSSEIERFDRLLGSQGRIARENWVEQAQILAKGGATAHSRDYDRQQLPPGRDPSVAAPARPKSITEAIKANAANMPPPATSAAQAPVGRADIAGLRSVRSEAYRPASDASTAAAAAAAAGMGSARVVRSAEIDDLKRIRGVGVLIEKRLNSVGIVSYGQIAEWTNEDIDRVSASLDFKGRIERENWVEQARILAAGGQTEFSRRVDRGEVETSRPKS